MVWRHIAAVLAAVHSGYGSRSPFHISGCPNAYFSAARGGYFSMCTGMGVPDILGHEYAHALEYHSVLGPSLEPLGLFGGGESGALSEGIADVFGELFEAFATGSIDWKIGTGSPIIARTIAAAEENGHPSTTFSPNFYCGMGDGGGVHLNSTVVSHIAYVLSEGGFYGTCHIEPIGREKVQSLFYRTLSTHLSIGSGFVDLYAGLTAACRDLWGPRAQECKEVTRALDASLIGAGTRCTKARAPEFDCDECPTDPEKKRSGVCGCGLPDADPDGDGIVDCSVAQQSENAAATTIVYPQRRKILLIAPADGRGMVVRIRVSYPRGYRPAKRTYDVDVPAAVFTVGPLPTGARVTVSLRYRLAGSTIRLSKESKRRTVVVR